MKEYKETPDTQLGVEKLKAALMVTKLKSNNDDEFVWPCMGVVVHVPIDFKQGSHVDEDTTWLREQLSGFNPIKVTSLRKSNAYTSIVEFSKDWTGFKDAMAFEKHFQAKNCGKNCSNERSYMYGWVARCMDYESTGSIGNYLRAHGDLRTISDLSKEGSRRTDTLIASLQNQVEAQQMYLHDLKCKYSGTTVLHENLMLEVHQNYNEGFETTNHWMEPDSTLVGSWNLIWKRL